MKEERVGKNGKVVKVSSVSEFNYTYNKRDEREIESVNMARIGSGLKPLDQLPASILEDLLKRSPDSGVRWRAENRKRIEANVKKWRKKQKQQEDQNV